MIKKTTILTIFTLFLIFLIPKIVLGQVTADDISIQLTPKIPRANQEVSIKISSYLLNLDAIKINWTINGSLKLSGIGEKEYQLKTGTLNKKINVNVVIESKNGDLVKNLTIQPSEVDIVWETTSSYAPPFYKGKILATPEAKIKFVALPNIKDTNGRIIKNSNFTYQWSDDYELIPDKSGFNKQYYLKNNDYLTSVENISVEANSINEGFRSEKTLNLKTQSPKILFYKINNDGIYYENSLKTNDLLLSNDKIISEPYFINTKNPSSYSLDYEWLINGQLYTPPSKNRRILSSTDFSDKNLKIDLTIENIYKLISGVKGSLNINVLDF